MSFTLKSTEEIQKNFKQGFSGKNGLEMFKAEGW